MLNEINDLLSAEKSNGSKHWLGSAEARTMALTRRNLPVCWSIWWPTARSQSFECETVVHQPAHQTHGLNIKRKIFIKHRVLHDTNFIRKSFVCKSHYESVANAIKSLRSTQICTEPLFHCFVLFNNDHILNVPQRVKGKIMRFLILIGNAQRYLQT